MQIVINISEKRYKDILRIADVELEHKHFQTAEQIIANGTPLEQEPVIDKINKMKSEIADSLEFWDYSPNNNPLARDMLETLTNFWGYIKAETEDT